MALTTGCGASKGDGAGIGMDHDFVPGPQPLFRIMDRHLARLEARPAGALRRLIPPSRDYAHEQTWHDGNGHSHLQATLLGPSLTVPVRDGKPVLGTWQQIFHIECDVRPRERTVVVTVLGE